MKAGNTFTIEPMINVGTFDVNQWPDNWTAVTVEFFLIFYKTKKYFFKGGRKKFCTI